MTEKKDICGALDKVIARTAEHDYLKKLEPLQFAKAPKLIQESSWTKTVPYKHWHTYVKPSDNIGSIFTPSAYHCRLKTSTKPSVKSMRRHLFDGGLVSPSRTFIEKHDEEMKRRAVIAEEKKHDTLPENIINLKDLADGTWLGKKRHKAKALTRKKLSVQKGRVMKKKRDLQIVRYIEAEIPKSVEEQLAEFATIIDDEQRRLIKPEDIEKVIYLRDQCISDKHLQPYDYINIDAAKKRIADDLRKREDFDQIMKDLEKEIIHDYKQSLRGAIVNYILMDSDERERLSIERLPVEFPVLCIRAPVPWHQSKITADHLIQHNLFIGNAILKDIRDLWFTKNMRCMLKPKFSDCASFFEFSNEDKSCLVVAEYEYVRYQEVRIIRMHDFGVLPVPAAEIEPRLNTLCAAATDVLVKEWLADVAEIFLEKRYAWSKYFEIHPDASTAMIEKYFRSVNCLLSKQLRIMIIRTLEDVRGFFTRYEAGNAFEGYYEDLMFLETPFVTVNVEPELQTSRLNCKPRIFELHTMISRCIDKIIAVGAAIPKIEAILFPELEHIGYLFSISRFEDTILKLVSDVLDVIIKHGTGPDNYLKCYEDLLYITSGEAKKKLDSFFKLEPPPLLREFEQQIRAFDALREKICMFRCKVSLNN